MKKYALFCFLICSSFIGCHQLTGNTGDDSADRLLTDFATAYFNYDLVNAAKYVTPESMKWLQFLGTNITQDDLDLLNQTDEAYVERIDHLSVDDTLRTAIVTVNNYFIIDSIEGKGHLVDSQGFQVMLVKRDNKWLVKMEGLPQSERQSHD